MVCMAAAVNWGSFKWGLGLLSKGFWGLIEGRFFSSHDHMNYMAVSGNWGVLLVDVLVIIVGRFRVYTRLVIVNPYHFKKVLRKET